MKDQKTVKDPEEDIYKVKGGKFDFAKKKIKIVPLKDTFKIYEEIRKKMCQF